MADIQNPAFNEFASLVEQINTMANSAALPKAVQEMQKWNKAVQSLASSELSKKLQRTAEQQKRAEKLGEAELFASQVNYRNRLFSLESRMAQAKESSNKRQFKQLREEALVTQQHLEFTKKQLDFVDELVGRNESLSDIDKKMLDNKIAQASVESKLQSGVAVNVQRQLEKRRQDLLVQEKMLKVAKEEVVIKDRESKLGAATNRFFGMNIDEMKEKGHDLLDTLRNPYIVIGSAIAFAANQLNDLRRETGAAASQVFRLAGTGIGGAWAALKQGVIGTPGQYREALSGLTQEYGRMDFITNDLVANQVKLTKQYGLSQEEAAHLLREIDFLSDRSKEATTHIISYAYGLAKANAIPVGLLLKDMAEHAELFARYGERGAQAFARAAVSARRIGINLTELDKFADTALDVEGFLTGVQRIRTFLGPNVLQNPAELIRLANKNDLEGLGKELQRQLGGVKIGELSRVQQNVLAEGLGLDLDTLQRITHTARFGGTGVTAVTKADQQGEKMDNLIASLFDLSGTLKGLITVLGSLALALTAGRLIGGIGGLAGGLVGGIGGLGGRILGGALGLAKGVGIAGGVLSLGTGLVDVIASKNKGEALARHKFTGLGTALGAGIGAWAGGVGAIPGALIGAGVGGVADWIANSIHPAGPANTTTSKATSPETPQPVNVNVDNSGIEMRLDDLLNMFREGRIIVKMDGQKVGNLIAHSFSRAP